MRKIIHHLRNQSEAVRTHVLHLCLIVAGVILVFLWVVSLGATFTASPPNEIKLSDNLQPFSAFKDNLVEGYKSMSATVNTGVAQ